MQEAMNLGIDFGSGNFSLDASSFIGFSFSSEGIASIFSIPTLAISYNFQSPETGLQVTLSYMTWMYYDNQIQFTGFTSSPFGIGYKIGKRKWDF